MLKKSALATILLLTAVALTPLHALDPQLELDEYAVERFTTANGLPQSSVLAMTQTRDGYLWLGTYEGLARFDGMTFTIFDKGNTPEMESNSIKALAEDNAGRLWIGTTAGLLCYSGGRFERFDQRQGLVTHFILCLHQDPAGTLWVGTPAGLYRWAGSRFQASFNAAQGLTSDYITALADDGAGGLWIGTGQGLNRVRGGKLEVFAAGSGLPHPDIRSLFLDQQGTLWIGTSGGGLIRFRDGRFERIAAGLVPDDIRAIYRDRHGALWIVSNQEPISRIRDNKVTVMNQKLAGMMSGRAVLEDREGSLWIGTRDGLLQLKDDKFILYGSSNGLPVDPVRAVFEDHLGRIWAGTVGGGLIRRDDNGWKTYNRAQGLTSDHIWSIAQGRDDALWVGTYGGGLFRLMPAPGASFRRVQEVPDSIVRSLLGDSRGRVWAGTNGGGLYCLTGGRTTRYTTRDGLPDNYIYALDEDMKGRIWIGTYNGGLAVLEGGRFRALNSEYLNGQPIWVVRADRDGGVWVGTDHAGLLWIRGQKVFRFTSRDGLYSDQAFQVLEDGSGQLWMNGNKGIYHVAKRDLVAFADGRIKRIPCLAFGKAEGIRVTESSGPAQPAGCIDRRGRIWFPTIRGLTLFDPGRQRLNRVEPTMAIERMLINGRECAFPGPAIIAPGKGNVEVTYTAVSFLQVDRMRFAYRLDGYDTEWVQAGNRRTAFYTNLPPGKYVFRIIAANGDGVWNRSGAAFAFTLKPYFTQTPLFRWLLLLAALLLVAGVFFFFLSRARARQRTLERLVDERTRQLQHLARYDGLTDLANHRTFYEVFQKEWAVAGREKKPLSVITADIDFFKLYNDSLGHQEGDDCLRKVAQAIRSQAKRPADLVARTGGEEFFILLPGTDNEGAMAIAASIRGAVAALAIPHPASPIAPIVTVSMGVATMIPPPVTEASQFIARADQALYGAKRSGRNRVCAG